MDNSGHHSSGIKKRSIDDIINNITSDLQSYEGRYMVLGNPRQSTDFMWQQVNNYAMPQQPNIYNPEPINMTNNNQYLLNTNQYNPYIQTSQTSIPPGFLNYDNQLYSHHHHHSHHFQQQQQQQPQQIHPPQQQQLNYTYYQQSQYTGHPVSYQTPSYGLFDAPCNDALIENLVQSWSQTQNGGVFSPFGNQAFQTSKEIENSTIHESENIMHNSLPLNHKTIVTPVKKVRMVAEVRPMRPSYSDVLAKSPANGPIKKIAACTQVDKSIDIKITHKSKTTVKKKKNANKVSKEECCLKRQNSSASSEERNINSEFKEDKKFEVSINNSDKIWTSSEDLNGSEYYEADENAYNNIQVPNIKENSRKEKVKIKTKTTPKKSGNSLKLHKENIDKIKVKKCIKSHNINKNMNKEQSNKNFNEFNLINNENSIDKQNDNEKLSAKTCSTQPQQQSSKNQGSRSTATFTALPFKARYQRGVKKRPRNSAINTLITKPFSYLKAQFIQYAPMMVFWFIHLLWDVVTMSIHLLIHLSVSGVTQLIESCQLFWNNFCISLSTPFSSASNWARVRWKDPQTGNTLNTNIPLPTTGEEALKRLIACKGKDPYSILGVTSDSSEDEIKKYYKRQAVLVHPDKNNQSGAEEAFKILIHAFNMIGDPEKRKLYDSGIEHIKENYDELNTLLKNLHEKMAQVANTIRCTSCGKRHKRKLVSCRPMYAARFCALCNVHHSARDGDIWAESSMFGLRWKYYGCMEGGVYNITDWATCQHSSLKHMRADTHSVQYRIIFGGKQQTPEPTVSPSPPLQPRTQAPPPTPLFDFNQPHLDEFLSSFYQHRVPGSTNNGEFGTDIPRQRTKNKRKK
ncbi:dnaJ homolog dnj-5 [Daktulosphaira vitifoliae]|uniref:dnaJ homolog dnj-5 n=1 Tax=Daktulosphaira vitifoliae TaxID=58002 RepID=UPI0021AA03EA|nr:dnaJ homolog dnj-5 [Daktulosphaira vitifoliae]